MSTLHFSDLCASLKLKDNQIGHHSIRNFTVSKEESKWTALRAMMHPDEFVPPGKYVRLTRGNVFVMSNTPFEVRTNHEAFYRATGRVLLNGLGIGMLIHAILAKKEVTELWVVELEQEVIDLVAPNFKDPRLKIIHADAFSYRPPRGTRFGAVWHDVWDNICSDNLPSMKMLHRRYGRLTDWQGSWGRFQCETGRAY